MPIKINGATSGSVTLAAPNTGSDVTLTLPTLGFGKVLQVVQGVTTTSFSTSSTAYTDWTNLSVAITPSSTSSRVLCLFQGSAYQNAAGRAIFFNLVRGSTQIAESYVIGTGTNYNMSFGLIFLDSPSTIASTTYKIQAKVDTGTMTSPASNVQSLTLIEVGP